MAVKELNKSKLLVERYSNDYSSRNSPSQIIWNFKPDVRTEPIETGVEKVVKPHAYGMTYAKDAVGRIDYTRCCAWFGEFHSVHKEAYAYPVVLKLKWD